MLTITFGLALIQVGDAPGSIPEFQAALRLKPDGHRLSLAIWELAYLQRTDFDAASANFKPRYTLPRTTPTLHYNLGLALKLKDQLPAAVAEFQKAAKLDPGQADVRYTLGVTLWQQGEFARAIEELQAAIKIRPITRRRRITRWAQS